MKICWFFAITFTLFCFSGCDFLGSGQKIQSQSNGDQGDSLDSKTSEPSTDAQATGLNEPTEVRPGTKIVTDKAVTVRDGQVNYGDPVVDESVEKKIYRNVSQKRKLLAVLEKNGAPGAQQIREENELMIRVYKARYQLTEAQIEAILKKGKALGWK